MWYFWALGVHAPITRLPRLHPFQKGEETSISYKLQHSLNPTVSL